MNRTQHYRAFAITVVWTLGLLWLGSVVHATESSLACPDWPTCYGSWVPEMTGGVFWEHLHRLVAGGLILFFLGATYLVWKEGPRFPWVLTVSVLGVLLLLVQAVFGGLTVIFRLPDALSTTHLGLAFLFLGLATALALVSAPWWDRGVGPAPGARRLLRQGALVTTALAFLQSVLGAGVRHTDAGVACPDVPLCLGQWIPPLQNPLVVLHFTHRVAGVALLVLVLWLGHQAFWRSGSSLLRRLGVAAAAVVVAQVLLGFFSVYFRLAVTPVSLHTLLGALLLTLLVAMAGLTWAPAEGRSRGEEEAGSASRESVAAGGRAPGQGGSG